VIRVTQPDGTDRLERLLGGPHIAWLVDRVRRRLELGKPLTGTVTLNGASAEQRRAVELLLGRRPASGTSLSVSLDEVDRTLRSSRAAPAGLAAAVEMLGGPVRLQAAEAATLSAAWREAYRELDASLAERPELAEWRAGLEATGLVRRLVPDPAEAGSILGALARVVQRLPSPGVPIGRLAAEACEDAHALDEGRPVGTLALSAARAIFCARHAGTPADGRREAWAAVGVRLDELSSTVLCLGLPGDSRTPVGRMLAAALDAGEPCVLTLRQLRWHEGMLAVDEMVRVCENPVVVAEVAEELGSGCPPLVCVNGRPSAAVWRLLQLLAESGARFAYHGDFDWGGVAIATAVYERFGWVPWRFDASAYEAAPGVAPLHGVPVPTPWDPRLASEMSRRGVRIEEELVLDDLVHDLAASRRR
jgi:uncharacterized protein (TIGR02679 family)